MYNITQTVVTTAFFFLRFLRKKLRPRATSASTFPSSSLPSYFRFKQKIAPNVRREFQNARDFSRARIRASFIAHGAMSPIVRFFWLHFLFFFSFFSFPSQPKIVGRRTRVIGQGSKTWKGYRNSLFLSSFLSFVAISLLFFLSVLILSLSFSSPLSPPSVKKKKK